jgi:hypothetical protein
VIEWLGVLLFSNQAAIMKYLFATAVTMAMLAGPAHAQMNLGGTEKDPLVLKYEREEKERAENEKAYNATMKRLKEQAPAKASSDPWKTVRPAGEADKR